MKIKAISLLSALFPVFLYAGSTTCLLSNGINVLSAKRILTICQQGNAIKSFSVALGNNGVGKRKAGDNKTPIGLYNLAYPRKSNQFDIFIPILYPTSEQLRKGYSGRDVGIHGPAQTSRLFSFLNNLPGATRGCVALGKNSHIEYVANWIKAHPGSRILIV